MDKERRKVLPDEKADQRGLIVYQSEDGALRLETRVAEETVWLPMAQIAELFRVVPAISKHIKNIYETGELKRRATVSNGNSSKRRKAAGYAHRRAL